MRAVRSKPLAFLVITVSILVMTMSADDRRLTAQEMPGSRPSDKHPTLESGLAAATRVARERGVESGLSEATALGMHVVDDRVRVVVESIEGGETSARVAVAGAGGLIEAEYANLTQALVPIAALEGLAADRSVRSIRLPATPYPEVSGEAQPGG